MIILPFSFVLPLKINSSFSLYISIKVFGNASEVDTSVFVNSNIPVIGLSFIFAFTISLFFFISKYTFSVVIV